MAKKWHQSVKALASKFKWILLLTTMNKVIGQRWILFALLLIGAAALFIVKKEPSAARIPSSQGFHCEKNQNEVLSFSAQVEGDVLTTTNYPSINRLDLEAVSLQAGEITFISGTFFERMGGDPSYSSYGSYSPYSSYNSYGQPHSYHSSSGVGQSGGAYDPNEDTTEGIARFAGAARFELEAGPGSTLKRFRAVPSMQEEYISERMWENSEENLEVAKRMELFIKIAQDLKQNCK